MLDQVQDFLIDPNSPCFYVLFSLCVFATIWAIPVGSFALVETLGRFRRGHADREDGNLSLMGAVMILAGILAALTAVAVWNAHELLIHPYGV